MSSSRSHHPEQDVVGFGRALRATGLPVGTGRLVSFSEAVAMLPPADLYWAGRTTLVSRREELEAYDRAFRAYFGTPPPNPVAQPRQTQRGVSTGEIPVGGLDVPGAPPEAALASSAEVLRRKSFARLTADELALVATLMSRLRLRAPTRRTRRRRRSKRGEPDLRRTLRRALRTGGEPIDRVWRDRRRRRRKLVLVLDVSGSMTSYSRALLLFAHAALRTEPGWEAFAFGTRLTRLTPLLAVCDPDDAIARAAAEAADWDGGTRIGASLRELLDRHGQGDALRGGIVIILSDGLDVGDPELLGEQMERLARLAHRIVWLNPLMESPDYAPLARGMRAALPHVDVFAAGHDLVSLEGVAETIARL
jgi:uncharacterized protein